MKRVSMLAAGAALAALAMASAAEAQTRVEVGVLTCSARGSQGFIIGSSRELRCQFKRQGRDEFYQGTIDKFGIDIGSTKQAKIGWAVLAPTSNLPPRSLNGTYAGVSAEATVGLGVGANALVGGSTALVRAAAAERAGAGGPQHRGRRRRQLRLRRGTEAKLHPQHADPARDVEQAHGGRGHVRVGRGLEDLARRRHVPVAECSRRP